MKKKRSRMMMGMLFLLLTLILGVVPVQAADRAWNGKICSSQAESVYFRRFQTDRAAQDRRKEIMDCQ